MPNSRHEPGQSKTFMTRIIQLINYWSSQGNSHSFNQAQVELKDRAGRIDGLPWYGKKTAPREPKDYWNIVASEINANVNTCVRAIKEAISLLQLNVVGIEYSEGKEVYYDDNEHPANRFLNNPNPNNTIREINKFLVDSYLQDGNGFGTIEKTRIGDIELWPRNPREVEAVPGKLGSPAGYIIGVNRRDSLRYAPDRVLHIRDLNATNPYYGTSRIEAVRDEIAMDNYVNKFNSGFFINGGALNLMFTPDHDLNEEQHEMLLQAMDSEISGLDNAFTMFINRFSGKITHPDQKHKDIAFLELLQHNREKIFSQFGLPPFRGGVMEWANYSNALAQDLDFWNNSIKPITITLEDAYNKQIMNAHFGEGFKFKFSYEDISALKGNPRDQADINVAYVGAGIKKINEVRADLGMKPLADDELPDANEDSTPSNKNKDADKSEGDLSRIIHRQFKQQQKLVCDNIIKFTVQGQLMSRLMDSEIEAKKMFDRLGQNDSMKLACASQARHIVREQGNHLFDIDKVKKQFDFKSTACNGVITSFGFNLENVNEETFQLVSLYLNEADMYNWKIDKLLFKIRSIFTKERADKISKINVEELCSAAEVIAYDQKLGINK